jgi:hypothetical protein
VSIQFGTSPFLDIRHFFIDLVIFFLFCYFAAKEYKTYNNDGFLHFWQGMSISFIVYVPAVLIFCTVLLFILKSNPSFLADYKLGAIEILEKQQELFPQNFSESDYNVKLATINDVTAIQLTFDTLKKKIVAGFFISPVVSILLRKKPK